MNQNRNYSIIEGQTNHFGKYLLLRLLLPFFCLLIILGEMDSVIKNVNVNFFLIRCDMKMLIFKEIR